MRSTAQTGTPHVLLVIGNIPIDRDRRVLREARSLVDAGAEVTVICPWDDGLAPRVQDLPSVTVRPYRRYVEASGLAGYLVEFAWAFARTATLVLSVDRHRRVDAVQFCNPPDIFAPLMWCLRLRGRWVVFDHHDLSPEVYEARKEQPSRILHRALLLLERLSLRAADRVVSTNTSLRDVAVRRAGVPADRVSVVRNGPLLSEVPRAVVDAGTPVVAYVGTFGRQDGVDAFVRACALVREARPDVQFVAVGDGETMAELRRLAADLELGTSLRFTGWISGERVHAELSRATVAVQPDPRNTMNELSTMAKTVEYLAHGLPVVAVDLTETRRTAGDAAIYVDAASPYLLAESVLQLLDDPARRERMSVEGRRRLREELAWDHQVGCYLAAFRAGGRVLAELRVASHAPAAGVAGDHPA